MYAGLLRPGALALGLLGLGASVASLSACSEASSASSADGAVGNPQAIVYGQVSGPEDDAVVQTVAKDSGVTYRCTGTLVAPNLVITARHCVSYFDDRLFTCTSDGELTPDSTGGTIGAVYAPSALSIRIHGGPNPPFGANAVQVLTLEGPSICRNDIAFIVLDRLLTDLPIKPLRLYKGIERNEIVKVIGYGVDETNFFGIRHVRDDLVVSHVGPSEFLMPGDEEPPRTFVTEGAALCIGDSGGPAIVDDTVQAGVWSQVVGDCKTATARNYFTQVAPFKDSLVLPAFEAAGAEPWIEGNPGPGLNTGGTVGTGGVGTAGDSSTAGEGATETGGTAGVGGSADTGGLVGSGGDTSSAGATESGGVGNTGGSGTAGDGGDGGLRKKGGCTCGVVGAPSGGGEFLLVPLAAFALLRRRRATPA